MGDPNQSLLQYQDAGVPLPSYVDQFAPPPKVVPPPIPPPLVPQQPPTPPPEQMGALLDQRLSGGQKSLDPTLWLNQQQKESEKASPEKKAEPKKKSLSALEQGIVANEAATQNERALTGDERVRLYKGLKQSRVVGPTAQQLEMAGTNEKMADSTEAEALNRQEKNEFDADAEIRRRLAYADFQAKEAEAMEKRQARIKDELDSRFAKIDSMSEAGTDHFWKSREAGAKARALEAIGGWRASNDIQAVFMHNAGGQGNSNAVFDMYKQAIDQDVNLQLKNRDFAANQLKERIAILGSREAAEMSLKKEKFDALAKQWDAYAAQSKTLEAKADNEVIARKAMAVSQGLRASMYELTKSHVEQGVNMEFYLRHKPEIDENPDVLDAADPAFAKRMLSGEKGRAEVGKLNAESGKIAGESGGKEDTEKLESQLQKSGTFSMHAYDDLFNQAEKGPVPGLGRVGRFVSDKPGLNMLNSDEEQKNNNQLRSLMLDLTKMRTGAQASDRERIDHMIALIGSGDGRSIAIGLQQAKKFFSETESRTKAGFSKKAVDTYEARVKQEKQR